MHDTTLPELPTFAEFYEAVHGWPPLPWQERLAHLVRDDGRWPVEIGVPTGLGKTSVLDVAVWALAAQAERPAAERTAPTRIWWLVNRRLLVDSTADHAVALAARLDDPSEASAVHAVGGRLRAVSDAVAGRRTLEVIRLRGGVATARPTDPAQPSIILSTIPMYGSRLLFRGYGSSRSMRPIDAALAGTDSLLLVDEAHLVRHLIRLFEPLDECDAAEAPPLHVFRLRPVVVSLTATGEPAVDRFDLAEDDFAHPLVRQRIDAEKPTRVHQSGPRADPTQELATAAVAVVHDADRPLSTVVFTNTPGRARAVAERIAKSLVDVEHDLVVLTGRLREHEAEAARREILDPVIGSPAQRSARRRQRHLVVVATQTLEVGADVDFDRLVTEACGVRSLTQRFGRLNRLGRVLDCSAVYVHCESPPVRGQEPTWPVYGTEPAEVLRRLCGSAVDGWVDLRVSAIADVLGEPLDDPGRAPEVLPALLDEWTKTTTPPVGEAPVEPYFSGIERPDRRVSVLWRAHVPATGMRLWPRARDTETIDVPVHEFATWCQDRGFAPIVRLAADRVTCEEVPPDALRSGDVVVLTTDAGGYDQLGWASASYVPVADVSLAGAGLPVDAVALSRLVQVDGLAAAVGEVVDPPDDGDQLQAAARLRELLRRGEPTCGSVEEWLALVDGTEPAVVAVPGEVARFQRREPVEDAVVDELDELSVNPAMVDLTVHGYTVGAVARRVADALGVPVQLADAVERAGRFHDLGKADRRFQRWLDPASEADQPVAKSSRPRRRWRADRVASGWPEGGRHEALSARLVSAWLARHPDPEGDLVMHLVVSHHGHARPLLVPVTDRAGGQVAVEVDGELMEACADLSMTDWDQPDRFWTLNRRHGRWGLALLEGIVRQADHQVSAGAVEGGIV